MRTWTSWKNVLKSPIYYFNKWSETQINDPKKAATIFGESGEYYAGHFLGKTEIFVGWPKIFIKDYGYFACPNFRYIPKKHIKRIAEIASIQKQKYKDLQEENIRLERKIKQLERERVP